MPWRTSSGNDSAPIIRKCSSRTVRTSSSSPARGHTCELPLTASCKGRTEVLESSKSKRLVTVERGTGMTRTATSGFRLTISLKSSSTRSSLDGCGATCTRPSETTSRWKYRSRPTWRIWPRSTRPQPISGVSSPPTRHRSSPQAGTCRRRSRNQRRTLWTKATTMTSTTCSQDTRARPTARRN